MAQRKSKSKAAEKPAKMEIVEETKEEEKEVVEVVKPRAYAPKKAVKSSGDEVLIGIDLGSYITKVSASNGIRARMYTIMGWPKDPISRKFIGKDVVFGEEVLKKRLALNIYEPVKTLIEDPKEADVDAIADYFEELKDLAGAGDKDATALICVPAKTTKDFLSPLREAAEDVFTSASFIPVPMAEGVALDLMHGLIVDVGASSLNLARMYGSIPGEDDYMTVNTGSNSIDAILLDAIREEYPDAQITEEMVRNWKEASAFIGRPTEKIRVQVPIKGVPGEIDITEMLAEACESLVPEITESVKSLIATFDPEFQPMLRENVFVTGGGSSIRGLPQAIEENMSEMRVKVRAIKDPLYLAADGALRILQEVPELLEEE